jgi:hypothetical protein
LAHDVFISYASRDKPTADAACAVLESKAVRCWIAPRDILPGRDWSEAIIDAIEGARIMVLVFSAQTNASRQIVREVERAVNKGLTIVTLRIEDVPPARNLEYFLGTPHWLDAITPPLERHLEYLSETVQVLLGATDVRPVPPPPGPPTLQQVLSRREVLIGAGGLAGLVALGFATGLIGGGGGGGGGDDPSAAPDLDPRLVGDWTIESGMSSASDGSSTEWTISLTPNGDFTGEMIIRDRGRVEPLAGAPGWLNLIPETAPQGYSRTVTWEQDGDVAQVLTSALVPSNLLQILAAAAQPGNAAFFLSNTEEYTREPAGSDKSRSGAWTHEADYGSMRWRIVLEIEGEDTYALEASLQDTGKMTAKDGTWRQVSEANGLQEGDYEVLDEDTVVLRNTALSAFGPTAQVTWRRGDKAG